MLSRADLHDYQNRAIDWIKTRERVGLFLDMGLGKSVTTLTAISDLLAECMIRRVLVIAPLRVCNAVWRQEAAKWEHLQHLDIALATGPQKRRLAALYQQAEITVINRENVVWLVQRCGGDWPFDALVIDESSSFKSSSSKRFRALKRVLPLMYYRILLTGTPSPNGLMDLWSQMYLIDEGASLGRTKTSYQNRWFDADYFGYSFEPRPGAAEAIHAAIAPRVLSMRAEDYLSLPERIDTIEPVMLPDKALRDYQAFRRDLFAELPDGEAIEVMSAASLANSLLQWCNGAVYTEAPKWTEVHAAKLDALADLVADNAGENILVAYNYKSDLARLRERFSSARVLDDAAIDDWNDGKIPLLLAHPASAGHGLNLQAGGSLAVWFGLTWSLEAYQQFNARLHRQGQTRPVRIVHLVAQGCLDERVVQVLTSKAATQQMLIDALIA